MTARRLWAPTLAAVLVTVLVGPPGVTAAEPRLTTASIMIPAAAFQPAANTLGYGADYGSLWATSGSPVFYAAVAFPVPVVTIRRITLYALDTGSGSVCAGPMRSRPVDGSGDVQAAPVCTQDASAPQAVYTTDLDYRKVNTALQGELVRVVVSGTSVQLLGVRVTYTY